MWLEIPREANSHLKYLSVLVSAQDDRIVCVVQSLMIIISDKLVHVYFKIHVYKHVHVVIDINT